MEFDKLSCHGREGMYALPNRGVQGVLRPLRTFSFKWRGVNYVSHDGVSKQDFVPCSLRWRVHDECVNVSAQIGTGT